MMTPASRKKSSPIHQYAMYSNLAFEMGAVIALGVFGGVKLDKVLHVSPLFTIICSLAGIAISLFLVVRTLSKPINKTKNEQKDTH